MCLAPSMKSASLMCSLGACGLEPGYITPIKAVGNPRVSVKECMGPLPAREKLFPGIRYFNWATEQGNSGGIFETKFEKKLMPR